MSRPVWTFEILRDTDAPMAKVLACLEDTEHWGQWHPRHRSAVMERSEMASGTRLTARHARRLGLEEVETFEIWEAEGRTILRYAPVFKGWPLFILMGWWRFASRRIWERMIDTLN